MMKMNYRKITEDICGNLTLSEVYTYYCLAMKSDYETLESNVNEDTLAEYVGINKRTVQRHLKKMIYDANLVKVRTINCKSKEHYFYKNKYKLSDNNYVLIGGQLVNEQLSKQMKGFLILLKTQCINHTSICLYTTQELADQMNVSKATVNRYLTLAEKGGYISWRRKEHKIRILRQDLFIETGYTIDKTGNMEIWL